MSKKQVYLLSALLPIVVMLVVFACLGVYPFHTGSVMAIDFASQYIDLFAYFKRAVLTLDFDSFFYSFSKSIGGDMIGLWGYYLMSPFNIFYVLIPTEFISVAATLTILARYGAMGLTFSHLLIKRYNGLEKPLFIPLFSLLYALNGFHIANQMNPIWFDAMVMLPLVIIGVETVLDGGKGYKYSIVLAASIIMQYYMSYMICLFIILYSFVYMARVHTGNTVKERLVTYFKPIARLAGYSFLAVGLSAILLYPVVQNLLISKGTYTDPLKFVWAFEFNPLDILSKLMIGAFDYDQMPSGLPNVYVGAMALVPCCLFFTHKSFRKREKLALGFVFVVFVISMAHDFSNKIWHLGQTPAWFYHRFSYLMAFLMVITGFRYTQYAKRIAPIGVAIAIGLVLIVNGIVYHGAFSFMTVPQQVLSTVFWLFVVSVFAIDTKKIPHVSLVVLLLSAIEVGVNAYISQSRIGYANALALQNSYVTQETVIDEIRPTNTTFYRIAKTYNRTKNDPFMHDFPGLTHFSSNMEAATLDLFDYLGDAGSNAATNYGSGTPLTDALYGVKYFVQMRNLTPEQKQIPNIYAYTRETTRKDLYAYYNSVMETDRLRVYQNDNVLSLGFGVSQNVIDTVFDVNTPAENQQKILQAFGQTREPFFTQFAFSDIKLDNFETDNPNDLTSVSLTRVDKTRPAKITYTFTPQTNEAYYISLPSTVNKSKNELSLSLNGNVYEYYVTFDHRQLWNVAYGDQGKEITFEISTSELDTLDIFNVRLWKLDGEKVRHAIDKRRQQNMNVQNWSDNWIQGTINVTDDSTYVMTTIPFSPGWQAWVDGQQVAPLKVWGSLLAVPITSGQHAIELRYTPVGWQTGVYITVVSFVTMIGLRAYEKRKRR